MKLSNRKFVKIPWLKPYHEWLRDELDAGLAECLEYRWRGLHRHILEEIARREQRDQAMYGPETYWAWLDRVIKAGDQFEFERGKITHEIKSPGHSNW